MMADVDDGQTELFDLYCQLCDPEKHYEAFGYCIQCEQHLCEVCFTGHNRVAVCRHHTLLNKNKMPKTMKIKTHDDLCTEFCSIHRGEIIKFFCKQENLLGCVACSTLKPNKTWLYIPEIVSGIFASPELRDMQDHLQQLTDGLKSNQKMVTDNNKEINRLKQKAKDDVLTSKKDMIRILGNLETTLNTSIDTVSQEDTNRMREVSQKCSTLTTDLQTILSEINENVQKKQSYKLFVAMKREEAKLASMTEDLASLNGQNRIHSYEYQADSLLLQTAALGKLLIGKLANQMSGIAAGTTGHITGMALVDDKHVAVCDYRNKSVKLISVTDNEVKSELVLQHCPWDITALPSGELIVTLPEDGKLHFLTLKNKQLGDSERDIDVTEQCIAVKYLDGKLVVSFLDPDRVEMLNLQGDVLLTFPSTTGDDTLFDGPMSMTVSPCQKIIYVANYWGHKVTSLMLTADKLASVEVFSREELTYPVGITCDKDGNVYVSCQDPASLLQISGNGAEKTHFCIFQSELDDAEPPAAILHLGSSNKLLLSHWSSTKSLQSSGNKNLIRVLELQ